MDAWVWWVAAAVVLIVIEVLSVTLWFVMMAGGALAAAIAAGFGAPVLVQFLVFALVAIALIGGVRPIAMRHLKPARESATGVGLLVGAEALVLQQVDGFDGRVKIGGEVWSAKSYDGSSTFPEGAMTRVVEIAGATALIA